MSKEKQNSEYPAIRVLTRKDRKTLSGLIQKLAERSGNIKLTEMIPAATAKKGEGEEEPAVDTDKIYELVKSVLAGLLEWVEDDVTAWFMDLVGIADREAYDALPFDIEANIIEQLISQKGFNNFFSRASALYKKIRG